MAEGFQCYTIQEFCKAHRVSRALLYRLIADNLGPRLMKAGRRSLISREAAEDWRRQMERTSGEREAA